MYQILRRVLGSSLLIISSVTYAQVKQDSTKVTDSVIVTADRIYTYTVGSKKKEIELSTSLNTTDELMSVASIYIKNYGAASLSTITFRGANPAQTRNSVQGVNINSTSTGMVDYAIVPTFLFTHSQIQYGAQSALTGSGSIGGNIDWSVQNDTSKKTSCLLLTHIGSFGQYTNTIKVQQRIKKSTLSIQPYFTYQENNYSYWNNSATSKTKEKVNNASLSQKGIFIQNETLRKKGTTTIWFWYQQAERGIISTISVPNDATQYDRWIKGGITHTILAKRSKHLFRVGGQEDYFTYQSALNSIDSRIKPKQYTADYEWYYKSGNKLQWISGIQYIGQWSTSSNYTSNTINQQRYGVFVSAIWKPINKLQIQPALRQEYQQTWLPLIPSIGIQYNWFSFLQLRSKWSRVYRVPTLNDLYWNPGGNQKLRAEQGWQGEAGVVFQKKIQSWNFQMELTGFYGKISNWILWAPTAGFWTSSNVRGVTTKGLELTASIQKKCGEWMVGIGNEFSYNSTVNSKVEPGNETVLNKQLIYTPPYRNISYIQIQHKGYRMNVQEQYTSWRFVTSDNTQFLDAFYTTNITLAKTWTINKKSLSTDVGVYNVFNNTYELMAGRPMPLRNYQCTIKLQL
ncbi:MAG: TonB-dependent receptor [Cytophagaceae bacterium]